jgi:RecA/RadA recombinase
LVENTLNSLRILMKLKLMWIRVHTFLMLLYPVVYLVVYLGIRLLQSQVKLLLEKLSFLAVVKNFLDNNPTGYCLYFDTEAAITKSLLESRGIDTTRLVVVNVVTVEEFRTKTLKAVDIYLKKKEEERHPCIFVLDSLGMLSTNKEINDALAEKDTRDMTKAQLIKGAFRMLTLKLGQAKIPMLVTNHTYESMSLYGGKQMSGGSGLQYAASTIIYLSKSKEKDGTEVIGNIIRAKTQKSRLSKENKDVTIRLYYDERGLDRYYGLLGTW